MLIVLCKAPASANSQPTDGVHDRQGAGQKTMLLHTDGLPPEAQPPRETECVSK